MRKNNFNESIQKNHIKFKTIKLCSYCGIISRKLVKCSTPSCNANVCKSCSIYINDAVFCIECMIKMMNEDIEIILFKPNDEIKKLIKSSKNKKWWQFWK